MSRLYQILNTLISFLLCDVQEVLSNTCVHSTGGAQKENDSGGVEASLTEVVAFALCPTESKSSLRGGRGQREWDRVLWPECAYRGWTEKHVV